MRKFNYVEIMDCKWCPAFIRDTITDFLQVSSSETPVFDRVVELIQKVMLKTNTKKIVDLCSGGGGPWRRLFHKLQQVEPEAELTFTDKFPNVDTIEKVRKQYGKKVHYVNTSIDAQKVPDELTGVRTFFGSFHHMSPRDAKLILEDAARKKEGIVVAEMYVFPPKIAWMTLPFQILLSPLLIVVFWFKFLRIVAQGGFVKTLLRLLFIYLIPVIPIVMIYDSFISSVRVYMKEDLDELTSTIAVENFKWYTGRLKPGNGLPPIAYVTGYPTSKSRS